jgi:hypothetical protein
MLNRPKIFISHCEKKMAPTQYAMRIIELIGCIPIIAEKQPKGSNSVHEVVVNTMDQCDAVIVIATADQKNGDKYSPSNGVSEELGILKTSPKFKNKYFVIIEEGVSLSAMDSIARYSFSKNNYGTIAEAILIELGSLGIFRNYYEMPGSNMQIHILMETLASFKLLVNAGHLNKDQIRESMVDIIKQFIDPILNGQ